MRHIVAGLTLAAGLAAPAAAQQAGDRIGGSVQADERTDLVVQPDARIDLVVQPDARIDLVVQPDEAEAVLEILELRAAGEAVPDAAWARLRAAEGYRRMMERERVMDERMGVKRGNDEVSLRAWLESDAALEGLEGRRQGLEAWQEVDVTAPAAMAMAYLPESARLRGTIYPIIRNLENSFIYDLEGSNPGIFMYVEPGLGAAELEHILAHEFHHMGLISGCADAGAPQDDLAWLVRGFAEGPAVLAAAGGPDGETHPIDWPDARDNWARRMDSLAVDMAEVDRFLIQALDGEVEGKELTRRGMTLLSSREGVPQGPFYSLGWWMAVTVERELGRQTLVDGLCRGERLFLDYDRAVEAVLDRDPDAAMPRWSPALLARLRARLGGADAG